MPLTVEQQATAKADSSTVRKRQLLTHSSKACFRRCRRLYWWRYEQRLQTLSAALFYRIGRLVHHAIEALETTSLDVVLNMIRDDTTLEHYDRATVMALIAGYSDRYASCNLVAETEFVEKAYQIPLINPATNARSRTFDCAGVIDSLATLHDSRKAIRETKTKAGAIEDNAYWRLLLIDSQISDYLLAARDMGYDVETIIYDVIRKPAMKPYLATPLDKRKYKENGELYANVRETDETSGEWQVRLQADITSRPDFYYQRREIVRFEQDLDDARHEAWGIAKDIRQAQLTGRWYRNPSPMTCGNCPFFNLCVGLEPYEEGVVPEGFVQLDDPHPELKG